MIEYRRTLLAKKYHQLTILECPKTIFLIAANAVYKNVLVENFRYSTRNDFFFRMEIGNDKRAVVVPRIIEASVNFQVSRADFLDQIDVFANDGCYCILHNSDMIKFRVSDLDELPRFKALDNFNWVAEIAIPPSASSGIGTITSPEIGIIDLVENEIKTLNADSSKDDQ